MPDETKGSKDNLTAEPGGSSSGTKGTSKDKGKLYTEEALAKIRSDAAAEAGRQRKAAELERDALKDRLEATNSRLDNLEREQNESRYAEARAGGSETLSAYQREQATIKQEKELQDKIRDLARREEQVKADREAVDKDRHVVSVAFLAAKHGLEPDALESLGISDPEVLERVAERLAGAKPAKEPGSELESEEIPSGEAPELFSDSGEGTGGGVGTLTAENVEGSSIAAVEKALEKASS